MIISSIIAIFVSVFGLIYVLFKAIKPLELYKSSKSKNRFFGKVRKRKLENIGIAIIPQNYVSYKQLVKLVEENGTVKEFFNEDPNNCLGIDNYE